MPLQYAGIGTREPTPEQAALCRKIGRYMAQRGWVLHTGGAAGCDYEFSVGAACESHGSVVAHVPWTGYNQELLAPLNVGVDLVTTVVLHAQDDEALNSVLRLHPAAERLSNQAAKLHARNYRIVKPDNASICAFVVALPSTKPGGGGTGQGIRVARDLGVPVIRLDGEVDQRTIKAQIDQLAVAAEELMCTPLTPSNDVLTETLPLPDNDTLLSSAVKTLRDKAYDGTVCPCCGQNVRIYKRPLTFAMVKALEWLVQQRKRNGDQWCHLNDIPYIDTKNRKGGSDLQRLQFWKLIEPCGKKGYWRATLRGMNFIEGRIKVERFCERYNRKVVRLLPDELVLASEILQRGPDTNEQDGEQED